MALNFFTKIMYAPKGFLAQQEAQLTKEYWQIQILHLFILNSYYSVAIENYTFAITAYTANYWLYLCNNYIYTNT